MSLVTMLWRSRSNCSVWRTSKETGKGRVRTDRPTASVACGIVGSEGNLRVLEQICQLLVDLPKAILGKCMVPSLDERVHCLVELLTDVEQLLCLRHETVRP